MRRHSGKPATSRDPGVASGKDIQRPKGKTLVNAEHLTIDLKRSRIAIYLQLASLFRNRISSGYWSVGQRLPNIDELAEEFGVARGTIRQAFDALECEGLVERMRAKGSFVKRTPPEASVHYLEMDWDSLTRAHQGSEIHTIENVTVASVPEVLREPGTPAQSYRKLRRLHRRNGQPYLFGTSYIDSSLYKKAAPERFEREPLLSLVQETAADELGAASQVLTIETADVDTAARLDVTVNSPVALMRRSVLSRHGALIYASEGLYRGEAVKLKIDLR